MCRLDIGLFGKARCESRISKLFLVAGEAPVFLCPVWAQVGGCAPLYFPAEVFFTAASAVLLLSTAAFALSNATRAALLLVVTAARAASMFTKNALGLLRLRSSRLGSRSPTPFAFPFAFVGALDAVVGKLLHVLFSRCRVY